jgi:hypothetical protein
VAALGDAWLSGNASATYTRTALEQTLELLETERGELVASPALLADPKGADLSQTADRLSRIAALVWKDVGDGNSEAARRHLAELGPSRAELP